MNYITIDGFEELTAQQVFDMSLAHVRKTRQPSLHKETGHCAYSGIGCAASVFLKEKHRKEADELGDASWYALTNFAKVVPETHTNLVQELQHCHDQSTKGISHEKWSTTAGFMKGFENRMKNVAEDFGLQYTPEQ